MRIVSSIFQWLSSGLLAVAVSLVAFGVISVAFEAFDLQRRLGVEDDACWLALLPGPALIVMIHRGFHNSPRILAVSLAGGLVLGGLGVLQFLLARCTRHVPTSPFSGIEHLFGMLLGWFLILVAVLTVLAGVLALVV